MRVRTSNGQYRYPKRTTNERLLQWECLRQHRMMTGHHPDTGEAMTPKQIKQWNAAIRAGDE